MSELYQRFIPEVIDAKLTQNQLEQIQSMDWLGNPVRFMTHEGIKFADAGTFFESVRCPFCDSDLFIFTCADGEQIHWWQKAMSDAYTEYFFVDLKVVTPCCGKKTTLHDLKYNVNQGFFLFLVDVGPVSRELDVDAVNEELNEITGVKWRPIQARY